MHFIIGVGGSSCSGKTTLASHLAKILNCRKINQDAFCYDEKEIPVTEIEGVACTNWDCVGSIDFDAFLQVIQEARVDKSPSMTTGKDNVQATRVNDLLDRVRATGKRFVVLDGFLLYTDARVKSLINLPFFMHTPYTTLSNRRAQRTAYITRDGTSWVDPPGYFKHVAYPEYISNNLTHLSDTNITKIDSSTTQIDDALFVVLSDLTRALEAE